MMVEAYRNYHHVPPLMIRSIQRWVHCLMPHQMTGNKPQSYLSGEHLLLLVYYKMIWPQASYFECIVFIANESSDSRIFNKMSISRALCSLGYTRKDTSTVAYQALTKRKLLQRRIFWDEPWPIVVNGFTRQHLIDANEFGLHLNAANIKYSSSPQGMRIRKPSNYDRGSFKLTIILAVEAGDPAIAPGLPGLLTKPRNLGGAGHHLCSLLLLCEPRAGHIQCKCKSCIAQAASTQQPVLPQVCGSARGSAETRASCGLPSALPTPGRTSGICNKSSMLLAGKAMVRGYGSSDDANSYSAHNQY